MSFIDGVVVYYLGDGSLHSLLGRGVLQFCIRCEEFNASFDYAICWVLLLCCFPCRMSFYMRLLVCSCVVSALPFCHVDGCCRFQCDPVDGSDFRNGVFDDFVELNHLFLFLHRINLPLM